MVAGSWVSELWGGTGADVRVFRWQGVDFHLRLRWMPYGDWEVMDEVGVWHPLKG